MASRFAPHRLDVAAIPAFVVLVPGNEVELPGGVAFGSLLKRIGGVGQQPRRIELPRFLRHAPDEFLRRRVLAVDLVAQSPGEDAGVIAVARDHLAQLFEAVFEDGGRGLIGHALEGVRPPGGNFLLHQDAVPVAVIEHAPVLLPVDACEDTVELLEVVVVVLDPRRGLGHAVVGMAPGHALHAHQPDALAVQIKSAVFRLEFAYPEGFRAAVEKLAVALQFCVHAIEPGPVEMPEVHALGRKRRCQRRRRSRCEGGDR